MFKDIEGYEGLYSITEEGQVYSHRSNKFLKPQKKENGYLKVVLCKNGKKKNFYLHRLTAQAFIENPDNLPCVNHKDECKENNSVSNLEWCTVAYNNTYGTRIKRISKPIRCVELDQVYTSAYEAARQLGLCRSCISECCTGKRQITGGYHWEYAEEGI